MARQNRAVTTQEAREWAEKVFGDIVLSSDREVCARVVCYRPPEAEFYSEPVIAFQKVYKVEADGEVKLGRNVGLSHAFRLDLAANDNAKLNYLLDKQANEGMAFFASQKLPATTKGKKGQPAPSEDPAIVAKFEELAAAGKITSDKVLAVALGKMTKSAAVMELLATV